MVKPLIPMIIPQPASPFLSRQSKLLAVLQQAGFGAAVLNPGPGLVYLTGLHFHLSERPVMVFFSPGNPAIIVLPELEVRKVDELPFPACAFPYGEDPTSWPEAFHQAVLEAGICSQRVGVEPTRLRFLELQLLRNAAPDAEFISAEDCLAQLRMQKDAGELTAMRQAVAIAQQALLNLLPLIRPRVTEQQLAAELTLQLLRAGSQAEIPFAPIVSSGPNSANPHASPSDRPLQVGDLLVIDWGATSTGYFSDLTRTFAIGPVESEFVEIAQIVLEANTAGRAAAKPGAPAEAVDQVARAVIEAAGYGQYFTHRTGHGLGMEGHEAPYIRAGNKLTLLPGMTFTVEPGIYLPGRGGVRIEDNLVITEEGHLCLSDLPRELHILEV